MNVLGGDAEQQGDARIPISGLVGLCGESVGDGDPLLQLRGALPVDSDARGHDGEYEQHRQDGGAAPAPASVHADAGVQEVASLPAKFYLVGDQYPAPTRQPG
jgi:hypothetical protein